MPQTDNGGMNEPPVDGPQDGPVDTPPQEPGMESGDVDGQGMVGDGGQGDMMDSEPGMEGNGDQDMMGGDEFGPQDGGVEDDSTMSIINQLSDTDKKAVRAYAQSMLDRDETPNNDMMQESFIFTKKQLDDIHEVLMTTLDTDTDNDINKVNKKTNHKLTKRTSPFDSPRCRA